MPQATAATDPDHAPAIFSFDNSFVRELPGLYEPWRAAPVDEPELLVLNGSLADALGADVAVLSSPTGVATLVGNVTPAGAEPVALAYSGHQFGRFAPVLGDGRALLLGEVIDPAGHRWDLHLKGSGRTPFARGGDGRAAVGPMLREYVMGEAMAALGVPTSRMLAVVATGEPVHRETAQAGAVLTRVAASHLRIGTFQYAASMGDVDLLRRLADHAIARHHPRAADGDRPYLALLEEVTEAQAALVARWMLVGFIHGVMNTDNVAISGETLDYGPCAFMDRFDADTVFSSIDFAGRYAYGNQPPIAQWNLARFAETLLELLAPTTEQAVELAVEVLESFPDRYRDRWRSGMAAKLGLRSGSRSGSGFADVDLADHAGADHDVIDEVPGLLQDAGVDLTTFFRALADAVRGGEGAARSLFDDPAAFDAWAVRWRAALPLHHRSADEIADAMDRVNPCYVPRNHLVEEALAAASDGDLGPFHRLVSVLSQPYDERPGLDAYTAPAPADFGPYQTFCGT